MLFPIRHDRNAVQITKKVLPLNKFAGADVFALFQSGETLVLILIKRQL